MIPSLTIPVQDNIHVPDLRWSIVGVRSNKWTPEEHEVPYPWRRISQDECLQKCDNIGQPYVCLSVVYDVNRRVCYMSNVTRISQGDKVKLRGDCRVNNYTYSERVRGGGRPEFCSSW